VGVTVLVEEKELQVGSGNEREGVTEREDQVGSVEAPMH